MRVVRALLGTVLLILGIPALLAGGALWMLARHADPGGAFTARFETVQTAGHAVVIRDVDALLRAEAPFARVGSTLRLQARTADGPAFIGLAPTDEVRRWLDPVPHATVRRVALSRGPLPVRLDRAGPATDSAPAGIPPAAGVAPTVGAAPAPVGRPFWVREGIGALEWSPQELADRRLSLVVMHPDGRPDLTLRLRAELRSGWTAPATAGLLAGGVLLVTLALLLLLRPVRPREVVFVVEPDQVPVLAGRLGVSSLSGLGAQPTRDTDRSLVGGRQLAAVGAAGATRPAIGPVPARRPSTLADLAGPGTAEAPRPRGVTLTLAWPPNGPVETVRPVEVADRTRPAAPADRPNTAD
ncbi:hypothetical protein ACIBXA_05720 [Micromonospora echinaurantiaca]|uniref:hypothetical protein n=1 Tax=Micromonospora TaxID=1873 RepID=UPI000D700D1B|nr:hypothetical protein DLJ47_27975 [Micromonospora sp. S4605]